MGMTLERSGLYLVSSRRVFLHQPTTPWPSPLCMAAQKPPEFHCPEEGGREAAVVTGQARGHRRTRSLSGGQASHSAMPYKGRHSSPLLSSPPPPAPFSPPRPGHRHRHRRPPPPLQQIMQHFYSLTHSLHNPSMLSLTLSSRRSLQLPAFPLHCSSSPLYIQSPRTHSLDTLLTAHDGFSLTFCRVFSFTQIDIYWSADCYYYYYYYYCCCSSSDSVAHSGFILYFVFRGGESCSISLTSGVVVESVSST